MSPDSLVIGLMGRSTAAINKGTKGYCWFPTGPSDPRYRGGKEWRRIKVIAAADIRANADVIVIDEKKTVLEHTLESPLINERKIMSSKDNLGASETESTSIFEVTGYNKICGYVYSDQNITVRIQQSFDKAVWGLQSSIAYVGATKTGGFSVEVAAQYARVQFVNGATATKTCRRTVQISAGD